MKWLKYFQCIILVALMGCQSGASKVKKVDDSIDNSIIIENVIPKGASPIEIKNDRVFIQLLLNDSIPALLFFDTGASASFSLWSNFAILHNIPFDSKRIQNSHNENNSIQYVKSATPISIKLGQSPLKYPSTLIGPNQVQNSDGLFSPNYETDNRIWELNFEHNYVKIWEQDTLPPYSMSFPILFNKKGGITPLVEIPILLIGKNDDTLHINNQYILDTGTPATIGFIRQNESLTNFVKNQPFIDDDFVVKEVIVNGIKINYGRFFCWKNAPYQIMPPNVIGTLGVNFLKHFNVFIDLKNHRLLLQKHDKKWENTQYSNLGCYFVRKADKLYIGRVFRDSPIYTSGINNGDEIVEINEIKVNNINDALIEELYKTPEGVVVKMIIKDKDKLKTISFKAYNNPLNFYN